MSAIIADNGLFMERVGSKAYLTTEDGSLAWTRGGTVLDEWGNYTYAHIAVATLDVPNVAISPALPQVGAGGSPVSPRILAQTLQPTMDVGSIQTRVPDAAVATAPLGFSQSILSNVSAATLAPTLAASSTIIPPSPDAGATIIKPCIRAMPWYAQRRIVENVTDSFTLTDYNDISFFAGEDIDITVQITMNGVALNFAGAVITWKMYHILTGIALTKDNAASGGVTINGDNESITLSFVKADTENLIPLTYFHEIRIAKSGAENVLIPQGRLQLGQSYTLMEEEA